MSILLVPCVAFSLDARLSNKLANSSEEYETYRLEYIDFKSNAEVALHEFVVNWNIDEHVSPIKSTIVAGDQIVKNTDQEISYSDSRYAIPKMSLGECVLESSGAYLLMEWTDRDKLGKFRRKFATIANLKAKTERALSKSGQFSKNYRDKNRRYMKNIQQLQEYAIAFRSYTISQGRNNDAALLDNLIDCRN